VESLPLGRRKEADMQATVVATRRERSPLNGVDTPNLFATINLVKGMPELAKFQFRARNRWIQGTHSRTVIDQFSGAGGSQMHAKAAKMKRRRRSSSCCMRSQPA
jgi:hypothetical protein